MADNRTIAQLLQAPTEGYEDAIVIPKINANFELKHGLINLVQNKQFFGHDKEDPHAHIRPRFTKPDDKFNGGSFLISGKKKKKCSAYKGPTIPTSSPRVVERRTKVTKDTIFPTNNGIIEDVQPLVVLVENQNPVSEPDVAPVSAPMPNPKPSIPLSFEEMMRGSVENRRTEENSKKSSKIEITKLVHDAV
ncbi:hypothetical protein Tco_1476951 [Tanacetum coccineum]